jgi:ribosomal protein S18 acetylase RimI-like enzyme
MTALTSGTVVLRPPHTRDRARVGEIVRATGVFRRAEIDVALEVFDGAVRAPGVDYHAIGAFEDDRLLGFACYGHTPCTVATWDLYWIAVDPDAHRRGVGRRLMVSSEAAIAARGGRLVVVETASRDDYRPTRTFYEAIGYTRAADIPDYYAPG